MPVSKVITLPPTTVIERLGLLDLRVNAFARTASITIAAADEKGEQVKGGTQIQGSLQGATFDQGMAALVDPFLESIVAYFMATGQIPKGTTIDAVK